MTTDAELERLALLLEEIGEAQQVIGKILRHGWDNYNPTVSYCSNRKLLEQELGDVMFALSLMIDEGDVSETRIDSFRKEKAKNIWPWLHFHKRPA